MQSQTQADADQSTLGTAVGMLVGMIVGMIVKKITDLVAEVMLMKMKDTQQQYHQYDTEHHQSHGFFDSIWPGNQHQTVRQEMIKRNAKYETRDKTHHQLDARMRHRNNCWQMSTEQRRRNDSDGVSYEKW